MKKDDAIVFDKEEVDLIKSMENDEWKTVSDSKKRKKEWVAVARGSLKKNKRVNIRLPEDDVIAVKKIAKIENTPYQTLLGSFVHMGIERRKRMYE